MAKYNIGGYIFNDEESAKKAAKELKTVEYILGQMKDADERYVLQIYNKLLKQRLFSTEIGMGFLSQLRQNLIASGVFVEGEVAEVYSLEEPEERLDLEAEKKEIVADKSDVSETKKDSKKSIKERPTKEAKAKAKSISDVGRQIKKLKLINSILVVISVTLLLCVIGMFYITSTINSPTILNYEEAITDEYSTWKQELEEKEAELKEREKALEKLENSSEQ